MKIDHIAIWTSDLNKLKDYYIKYFEATVNNIYINKDTSYSSYFLSFASGTRIEIMKRNDIPKNMSDTIQQYLGIIHIAFSVNIIEEVDQKAQQLKDAGFTILRGPRITGDGYYEFETLDPDNNRLEVLTKYEKG